MSEAVIIFGTKDLAQLAHYYLSNDTNHTVVGFSVHKKYMPSNESLCGLSVYPFETIESQFSPMTYRFFAPITGTKMNKLRESIYDEIKAKGYGCISYVSSKATVLTQHIGENCFIQEDNTVQPFVTIGNNVVLWAGNHIGHHSTIDDHVFFTSHVVLSGHCEVNSYSWLGVNATVRDGCKLAEGTCLAMGACLTKEKTEPWSLYMGTPAKKREGINPMEVI